MFIVINLEPSLEISMEINIFFLTCVVILSGLFLAAYMI